MTPALQFSAEVAQARADGTPLVALESTIITHGMPFPQNAETARSVEDTVRREGAVPATIAVMDGRLHVGLEPAELEALAQMPEALKLSRADMAFALATGRTGATTVAATMIGARLAGIDVFATGGIGGVHRGAGESFDISADLMELAQTPVTVVAAGAKAILDLPKTLEVLETQGVPVVAFGQDAFPAFWSRASGLPAPLRADTAHRIKAVLAVHVDTSTSIRNDIAALRAVLDAVEHPALLMADCIASLGCDRFEMDAWGADVMVAGCQKGLMVPPGMAFVFFNAKAQGVRAAMPRVSRYWDWEPRANPDEFFMYWNGTAPTHHLYGLRTALDM